MARSTVLGSSCLSVSYFLCMSLRVRGATKIVRDKFHTATPQFKSNSFGKNGTTPFNILLWLNSQMLHGLENSLRFYYFLEYILELQSSRSTSRYRSNARSNANELSPARPPIRNRLREASSVVHYRSVPQSLRS